MSLHEAKRLTLIRIRKQLYWHDRTKDFSILTEFYASESRTVVLPVVNGKPDYEAAICFTHRDENEAKQFHIVLSDFVS